VPSEPSLSLAQLEAQLLPSGLESTADPVLIMMSGLPGSGKSHLSRVLAERVRAVVIESDAVRKALFPEPCYTADESAMVHRACQQLMRRLLTRGVRVVFDATNLVEFQREIIYSLVRRSGARLLIVRTVAPEEVIRERLTRREESPESASDADWRVYRRMAHREQKIRQPHVCIDTSQDMEDAVRKVMRVLRRGPRR
jgi:predicted kinase